MGEAVDTAATKVAKVTLAFWVMKTCTTTVGETGGDLLTKPPAKGGLGFGTIGSTAVLLSVLVVLVVATTRKRAPMSRSADA